jgi:hypothetical protein
MKIYKWASPRRRSYRAWRGLDVTYSNPDCQPEAKLLIKCGLPADLRGSPSASKDDLVLPGKIYIILEIRSPSKCCFFV